MNRYRTYEEVGDEYARLMGPKLGQLYHELQIEVDWLHIKWGQYRELFGKDSARIDLLNRAAPLFFRVYSIQSNDVGSIG